MCPVSRGLVSGAGVTTRDIGVDKGADLGEVVGPGEEVISLLSTKMPTNRRVMNLFEQFKLEVLVVGDKD
jgi:hypothetical protein